MVKPGKWAYTLEWYPGSEKPMDYNHVIASDKYGHVFVAYVKDGEWLDEMGCTAGVEVWCPLPIPGHSDLPRKHSLF